MHRDLEISVAAEATDRVVEELRQLDGVITLSVHRGESIKPPGDVISATVLNIEADAVLQLILESEVHGPVSISTGSVDSVIDTENQRDVDEVAWEEAETAMRRHSRPAVNFFVTTAGGGVIAAAGLTASSGVTEATALVAAAIVAPVFEPLVRLALAAVTRHGSVLARGLLSAAFGYLTVIAASLLTMLVLRAGGRGFAEEFLRSSAVHEIQHPPLINLILSAAGAVTGVVMVAAGRFTQLAGPVVALQLLPAAAAVGIALELGRGAIAARSFGRLAIDVGMVIIAGLIVFTYKHVTVHSRRVPPR
jgi:hypothetical protein